MRPIEYDINAIIEAGRDLEAEGRPVTGYALRRRVGGGNAERLRAVWDDWLLKEAANDGRTEKSLPAEIIERLDATSKKLKSQLTGLVAELHSQLHEVSVREIEANNEQAKLRERDLRNELTDAGETVAELEKRAAEAESRIEALQNELAAATEVRQAAEVRHAEAVAQNALLQVAASEAAELRRSAEIERAEALRAAAVAREELAHSTGEASALRKQIKELLALVEPRPSASS